MRIHVKPVLQAAGVLLWCLTLSTPTKAQDAAVAGPTTPLTALLERAGRYVTAFRMDFAQVVGAERYRQEVHAPDGGEMADLESEVFFVGLDDRRSFLTVRNVLSVNGLSVEGARDSVADLLARGNHAGLRELADASARYNIGQLHRNFNDPTLVLSFLEPASQTRFRFSDEGKAEVDGIPVRRVAFEERQRPTIIRDARSRRDAPSSGIVDVADDGRVLRWELRLRVPKDTTSVIRVSFGYEPRLELMVPTLMEEEYRTSRVAGQREVITCRATYSNYRRFETQGRILAPSELTGTPR